MNQPSTATIAAEFLPPIARKPKKPRVYKTRAVSFYLHPRLAERSLRIRALLDEIADREAISMDEVKFAFIDYSRHFYLKGALPLEIHPNPATRKLTVKWVESDVWRRELKGDPTPKPRPVEKQKYSIALRCLPEQVAKVRELARAVAEKHSITPGEIVLVFLEYAATQYIDGKFSLKTSPAIVESRLDGWGVKTQ
jgi:hypothetical protein